MSDAGAGCLLLLKVFRCLNTEKSKKLVSLENGIRKRTAVPGGGHNSGVVLELQRGSSVYCKHIDV